MDSTPDPTLDVVAVGSAIVDVLAHVDDDLITSLGLEKGMMALVDHDRSAAIYDAMPPGIEVSGGSAANTAAGIASLGGAAAFVDKVRDDALGEIFVHDLRSTGVVYSTPAAASGPPTARSLILVTPDAERTMNTYLGVASEMGADDVDPDLVASAKVVYLEGYLVGLPSAEQALTAAIRAADAAGRRIALTLSDPSWVAFQRDAFQELLPYVDFLIGNEAEALVLTGEDSVPAALQALTKTCPVVAVTQGAGGAIASDGRGSVSVRAEPVEKVEDTTGAGDLFAAGFLLGLARQRALMDCLRLGTLAAAEVISHMGARPQTSLSELAAAKGIEYSAAPAANPEP
ncbi:MAG TPA: adenosine kinase [Acidimicrobiia bacterium]|nr:adenosine kinase [Acidimicrobiia bacterium]